MIEIDGSYLEGGGAILRVASALSAITGKPMKVFKIRAGRENPGLRAQHLEGLRAVASLCSGRLVNAALGSTEIEFYPEKIRPTQIDVQISTAGAIGLVFQSLKVPICMADGEVIVNVKGGATFGKWAPPLLSTINVLLPTLKKMGYAAEITINRHGFYPVGGAEVEIKAFPYHRPGGLNSFSPPPKPVGPNSVGHLPAPVAPNPHDHPPEPVALNSSDFAQSAQAGVSTCKVFRPLDLTDRGSVRKVIGMSIASESLRKPRVAERQAEAASATLRNKGLETAIQPEYVDSKCAGSGIVLWSTTSTGAILEADSLGERGKPSETVGEEAAKRLLKTMDSGAAVDAHLSDQLLIFMALAEGKSAITAPKLTDHAKTNIYVIQKFLPVEFRITAGTPTLIECSGSEEDWEHE